MTQPKGPSTPSYDAVRAVSVLHQLTLESVLAESRQELEFRILNRTVALCPYDRASLWAMDGRKPALIGVSGKSSVDKYSELAAKWRDCIAAFSENGKNAVVNEAIFESDADKEAWKQLGEKTSGLSVLWLPIYSRKKLKAGLWLERWGEKQWQAAELKLFQPLTLGYGAAWEKLDRPGMGSRLAKGAFSRGRFLAFVAVMLALLIFVRLPLRVVAPCTVVAKDPLVVTAPLNGVVEEVVVEPGQSVDQGELLFIYDKRVALEELEVAEQQVRIIESSLNRSRMLAFGDEEARAEIAILEHRLEQEKARLELAEYNVSRLEVTADLAGQVVIDDPHEWRGRPVVIGERVLELVKSEHSKLRIWLPDDDNVDFDEERQLKVFLNAFPDSSLRADLAYVAPNVGLSPDGVPSVMAEAQWRDLDRELKIGLQGTAVLYGDRVSLAYWLLRKPWAWMNRVLGL